VAIVNPGQSQKPRFVQGVTGAFMGLRAESLHRLDQSFFMAYEDVDFCLKTWGRGEFVFFDGTVDVVHHEGATRGIGLSKTELDSVNLFKSRLHDYVFPRIKMLLAASNKQLDAAQ
jgi:GT2 family glycosyltransferase